MLKSPKDAIEAGIGMVHQHFMLVPSLTVTENIILNYPSKREPFLNLKESEKKIKEISGDYGLDINPGTPVWQLSVGEQQKVEILKLLYRDATLWENAILKNHDSMSTWHFLKFKNIRKFAGRLVEQFTIKPPSIDTPVKNLSGGNIQKLILARELSANPSLLIASHPTRGVDIGATEYIHKIILEKRREGMGVILISEDLDEIRALSDRIAVMYEGEIVGIVPPSEEIEKIGLMMGGERRS